MKHAFYELKHEIRADYFTVERNANFSFPLHMHRCYEIILLLEGSMKVYIEKDEYVISAGDMIFIKPNCTHSLETEETSRHILCVFSPELIAAISGLLMKYPLISPVCRDVPTRYCEMFEDIQEEANIGKIKGFLYSISGLFYEQLDFSKEDISSSDKHLLRDIFLYVENNMSKPSSIVDLGKALDYSPGYLSRFFITNTGIPYSAYVRNIRMNHACYLLRNTAESIMEISQKCGYVSINSFNRNFKQMTGITPTTYRANHGKHKTKGKGRSNVL